MPSSDPFPFPRVSSRPWMAPKPMRASRCFRTDAEGRITLDSDRPKLLRGAQAVGPLVLQTGHVHARLIALTEMPAFVETPDGSAVDSDDGALQFSFAGWARAWGSLRPCACCDSPAQVDVCNAAGRDFLELCALPNGDAASWAEYLGALASPVLAPHPEPTSLGALPLMPASVFRLRGGVPALVSLLMMLGAENVPVVGTLRTPEAAHTREFVPRHTAVENGVLSAGEARGCVQLALCAMGGLALQHTRMGWALYVAGFADTVMFAFSPPAVPGDARRWHAALRTVFPFVR